MRFKKLYAAVGAMPVILLAFSTGPPQRRTGAAVDGGLTCNACHGGAAANPVNSDPRGSLTVTFDSPSYVPGTAQTIHVKVIHPELVRWGFQMTARLASDVSKRAGTFTSNTDIRVRCDNGPDSPCDDGVLEFAEHRNAPRTAAGVGFTFDVPWTPPATNAGDIVFYVAGNAADGNGAPGPTDKIYNTVRTLSAPCSLSAKPTITALTDSASYRAAWAPNGLLSLFGTGFAASGLTRGVQAFDIAATNSFPKELGCVAVEMGGVRVPVTYVSANQLNIQAPTTGQASGNVPVTVILNPGRANEVKSDVVSNTGLQVAAPALFTFDSKSVIAQVAGTNTIVADPTAFAGGRPARPGELITIYATGLGFTDPVWQAGEIPARPSPLLKAATVSIGGVTLAASDVLYAGLAVGSTCGLYQINARVPATAQDGNLPVVVTVNGAATQTGTTIPVRLP